MDLFLVISFLAALIAAFIFLIRGFRPALYYVISWVMCIFGAVLCISIRYDYIPSNQLTGYFFSLALSYWYFSGHWGWLII